MDKRVGRKSRCIKKVHIVSSETFLPNDILINITSRLPTKDVLRWQCVSKFWKNTTSTNEFKEEHVKNIIPMIVVEDGSGIGGHNIKLFLDKWWEPKRTNAVIHRFLINPADDQIQFSQVGFLVMKSHSGIRIFNPVNQHGRYIIPSDKRYKWDVFGIYWHPNMKEYCTLLMITGDLNNIKFLHQSLESNLCLKVIDTPSNLRIVSLHSDPVLVSQYMYRIVVFPDSMVKIVLKYDINKELFTLITCPEVVMSSMKNENLLNIDGVLTIIQISSERLNSVTINLWTLNDHEKEKWVCCNYSISSEVLPYPEDRPKAIGFLDGKLVFELNKAMFVADLNMGTTKKFGRKKYKNATYFGTHLVSLASLNAYKTEIFFK